MNRGNLTPKPQQAISYQNPNVYVPGIGGGGAPGQTVLAILAGAGLGGYSATPTPQPGGNQPLTTATLAGALL